MKSCGYILESFTDMGGAYTCRRLIEEAATTGISLSVLGMSDTRVLPDSIVSVQGPVPPRDFVINRYKWGHAKDAVNALCGRGFNGIRSFNAFVDKFIQMQGLRLSSCRMPDFVLANGSVDCGELFARLSSPFVAKGLESSMGREVFLIKEARDFRSLVARFGQSKEWLCEEFVETSAGRDMRLFVVQGIVVAAMQRESRDDFRANVALGANCHSIEITDAMRNTAKEIHEQTGLLFFGLDLLFGSDSRPVFCEVNVMPGIRGIEEACHVNAAGRVMEAIVEELEHD